MVGREKTLGQMSGNEHDCWLAMRSAYAEYCQAAEAVQRDGLWAADIGHCEHVAALERRQREAFERYFEARMEFLESRFDETCRYCQVAPSAPDAQPESQGFAVELLKYKWVVEVLAIVLLCATTFSSVRESQHVRELEADRDNLQGFLTETQQSIQRLDKKVSEIRIPASSVSRLINHAAPGRPTGRKPSEHGHWRRLSAKEVPENQSTAKALAGKSQNRATGRRIVNNSMPRSRESERLGPAGSSLSRIGEPDEPGRSPAISGLARWLASNFN